MDEVTILTEEYDRLVEIERKYHHMKSIMTPIEGLSITMLYDPGFPGLVYGNRYAFSVNQIKNNDMMDWHIGNQSLKLWKGIQNAIKL